MSEPLLHRAPNIAAARDFLRSFLPPPRWATLVTFRPWLAVNPLFPVSMRWQA
ncbi:hypothetical protein [Sphingopyxis sp. H115]|uniref:hypothetical protein n=1 Tax=Sphingopyxis sp. H115 TaxID=1759073 RepID=UPI00136617D9|nr:hypothetical protein [Sphingopyxis sp. H115]